MPPVGGMAPDTVEERLARLEERVRYLGDEIKELKKKVDSLYNLSRLTLPLLITILTAVTTIIALVR